MSYLELRNEKLSPILLDFYLEEKEKSKSYSIANDPNENIEILFKLIKVTPPNILCYEWIAKNLEMFTTVERKREVFHAPNELNYNNEKIIHQYISEHYPDKLEENKKYYSNITDNKTFMKKRLFQGELEINIYGLMSDYNVKGNDTYHFMAIAKECLNVVARKDFQTLINEDIQVFNIADSMNNKNLVLNYSTSTLEQLDKFEIILLTALDGVLKVSDKIYLSVSDDWDGEESTHTNMDAQFIYKQYSYHHLEQTLDTADKKTKKIKI